MNHKYSETAETVVRSWNLLRNSEHQVEYYNLRILALIGAGGAAGSVIRFVLSGIITRYSLNFPLSTLFVNASGSFLIGFFMALYLNQRLELPFMLFLTAGFCGGFTTFSTFSLENLNLIREGRFITAGIYVLFSFLICLLLVWAGFNTARR